jgi:hypothetical protein
MHGPPPPAARHGVALVDPADLPPDARDTIYIDALPNDVSKRELAHIFRPFEGYRVGGPPLAPPSRWRRRWGCILAFPCLAACLAACLARTSACRPARLFSRLPLQNVRLVVRDSIKVKGEKVTMGFIEFTDPYLATVAMATLQVGGGVLLGGGWGGERRAGGGGLPGLCGSATAAESHAPAPRSPLPRHRPGRPGHLPAPSHPPPPARPLALLQGYPLDLDEPETLCLKISYAHRKHEGTAARLGLGSTFRPDLHHHSHPPRDYPPPRDYREPPRDYPGRGGGGYHHGGPGGPRPYPPQGPGPRGGPPGGGYRR